mgnify:CR=1 FL=1
MVKIFSLGLYVGFLVFLYIAEYKGIFKDGSRFKPLKPYADNVKVVTYLYIVFWLVVYLLSILEDNGYLHIEDSTYILLAGVWSLNIMAIGILSEK